MTTPLPVPFAPLEWGFGTGSAPEIQSLLDGGNVLAFSVLVKIDSHGYGELAGVRIALPCPDMGVRWIFRPADIRAADAHQPGLLYATLAINQDFAHTYPPVQIEEAWDPHGHHQGGGSVLARLDILRDGFVIGDTGYYSLFSEQTRARIDAQRRAGAAKAHAQSDLDAGRFATIALPITGEGSAHGLIHLLARTARVFAQWQRIQPEWAQALPFVAPTLDGIQAGLARLD